MHQGSVVANSLWQVKGSFFAFAFSCSDTAMGRIPTTKNGSGMTYFVILRDIFSSLSTFCLVVSIVMGVPPNGWMVYHGKYTLVIEHNYGKSQFFMGKFTINGDFP